MEHDIRPLTPATWGALAALFAEGGDASWCWCAFWRTRGAHGSRAEKDQNRELLRGLAERDGVAPGLVAMREGRAVGWVSLGPREEYARLVHSTVLAPVDEKPVWSIVCFSVSKAERGSGVATALLDAAIDYARENGATMLEAYPAETNGRKAVAGLAGGTIGMFERAGFEIAAVRQANPRTRPRLIVRRQI